MLGDFERERLFSEVKIFVAAQDLPNGQVEKKFCNFFSGKEYSQITLYSYLTMMMNDANQSFGRTKGTTSHSVPLQKKAILKFVEKNLLISYNFVAAKYKTSLAAVTKYCMTACFRGEEGELRRSTQKNKSRTIKKNSRDL